MNTMNCTCELSDPDMTSEVTMRAVRVRLPRSRTSEAQHSLEACRPARDPGALADKKREEGDTKMGEKNRVDHFEERLLEYVEMLYGVALKLTHNPRDAERVTRIAMLQVWRRQDKVGDVPSLKAELLKTLRHAFIDHCQAAKPRDASTLCSSGPTGDGEGTRIDESSRTRRFAKNTRPAVAL